MSDDTLTLSELAARTGRVSDRELDEIRRWLDDDWESHDVERDATLLIRRLTDECARLRRGEGKR